MAVHGQSIYAKRLGLRWFKNGKRSSREEKVQEILILIGGQHEQNSKRAEEGGGHNRIRSVFTAPLGSLLLLSFFVSPFIPKIQSQKASQSPEHLREQAIALISSAAARVKDLDNSLAQVQVLTEAADLMWWFDVESGRGLFRQAGERVLSLDKKIDKAARKEVTTDLMARLKLRDQKLLACFQAGGASEKR